MASALENPGGPSSGPEGYFSIRDIGMMMNAKRKAATQPMRGAGSAWLDQDDSGNYDPAQEGRRRRAETPPRRAAKRARVHNDEGGTPRPSREPRCGKKIGYGSFLVTLQVTSNKGLEYLRSISPGPYSDEESEESETDSDQPLAARLKTRRSRKTKAKPKTKRPRRDGLTIDDLTIGHPQRRGCKKCFEDDDVECSLIACGDEYPCETCLDGDEECELITPPKLKRVCERCKKKRMSCSFRVNGGVGVDTCHACAEAKVPCCAGPLKDSSYSKRYSDLIDDAGNVLPEATRARRVAKTSSRPTKYISRASDSSQASKSLPTKAASKPKLDPSKYTPRVYVSCNRCRQEGHRCNLKRDQPGPCSKCKHASLECAFVLIPPSHQLSTPAPPKRLRAKKPARHYLSHSNSPEHHDFPSPSNLQNAIAQEAWYHGAGRSLNSTRRSTTPASRPKKPSHRTSRRRHGRFDLPSPSPERLTNGYPHITISTSFSHPLHFNYLPAPFGLAPCSFHGARQTWFGLVGYGDARSVSVIAIPEGYEEVGTGASRGYGQLGEPETNMCQACTNLRMNIISCTTHRMALLLDQNPLFGPERQGEWAKAVEALARDDFAAAGFILEAKFCSVCTSIAEYGCCAPQDAPGDDERGGCGLLLCEACNELLGHIEAGKAEAEKWEEREVVLLDRLLRMVERGQGGGEEGMLRADAMFLHSTDSLLLQTLLSGGDGDDGEAESEEDSSPEAEDGEKENVFTGLSLFGKREKSASSGPKKVRKKSQTTPKPRKSISTAQKSTAADRRVGNPEYGVFATQSYNASNEGSGDFLMSVASGRKSVGR